MNQRDPHLAQLNVGKLRYEAEDPRLSDFMDNLERVNSVAERSAGFVWRYVGEGDSVEEGIIHGSCDPTIIANLTVWENAQALENFVWNTVHKRFYNRKSEWFSAMSDAHFVMWWVAPGHFPSMGEAEERLAYLNAHGPSAYAFGWESLPNVELWKSAQCA